MAEEQDSGTEAPVSRRRFVQATGATGVAAGIAGCSGGGGGGDGTDTTTTSGDGGGGDGGTTTIQFASDPDLKAIQPKFNQWLHDAGLSKDIKVEILAGSNITNKRQSKYNRWLSSGRSEPSILMMDSGWTIPFIARNYLLNLSEAIPDTAQMVKDEYFQASVDTALGRQGNLFAIPMFPDFPTMQYRKDLLRDVGYGDSDFSKWATESMSWKQFSEITKKAKQNAGTDYGFTFQFKVYEGLSCCDFNEFLSSFGGAYFGDLDNLFGPVGERPITVDEKPVVDSLKMLRTFIYGNDKENTLDDVTGGISPQAVLQWSEEPSRKPFTNGEAVMHRNWPYSININGKEENFGKDLGVMPIPYREGATSESFWSGDAPYKGTSMPDGPVAALGGWHAAVNPNTKNKEAALEVMKAMTSKNVQYGLLENLGWLPPRPPMLESQRASQIPVMGRYMEQLRVAGENAIPRPVTVVWPQQSSQIAQEANAAVSGEKTPTEAMTQLKDALKQIEQSV